MPQEEKSPLTLEEFYEYYMRDRVLSALDLSEESGAVVEVQPEEVISEESGAVAEVPPEEVIFNVEDNPKLKITKEGFYVDGKKIVDDRQVYDAFVEWVNAARAASNLPPIEPVKLAEPENRKRSAYNRYTALTQDPSEDTE